MLTFIRQSFFTRQKPCSDLVYLGSNGSDLLARFQHFPPKLFRGGPKVSQVLNEFVWS